VSGARNAGGSGPVEGAVPGAVARPRWLVLALLVCACAGDPAPSTPEAAPAVAPSQCPTTPDAVTRAPDVDDAHEDVATWLAKLPEGAADEVLVTPARAEALNAAFASIEGAWRDPLGDEIVDPETVTAHEQERLAYLQAQVASGTYEEGEPGSLAAAQRRVDASIAVDEARVVVDESALFCVPLTTGLYKPPRDPAFDRNRCASLHPGEVVRVVRRSDDGHWLALHAGHTSGWSLDPSLTPPIAVAELREAWSSRRVVTTSDDASTQAGRRIRLGTQVPVVGEATGGALQVLVPTADGLERDLVHPGAGLHDGTLPLTRRALWTAALAELDAPYGWGDRGGNRDCSRLVRDLFVAFGLQLPRHSGVQAKVGTHDVDVAGLSDADKRAAIETWAARGVVILYMPGHVMIYLGADGEHLYAVSAISDFLTPCDGGKDSVHVLDRVAVSTLEVGRGTERTAFIERITRLVVFAPADPDPA
jgi:hypothetical protein